MAREEDTSRVALKHLMSRVKAQKLSDAFDAWRVRTEGLMGGSNAVLRHASRPHRA